MPAIETHSLEITDACILKVEAGTNCPKGGDSGHGGRTVFRLIDEASTNMRISVDGRPLESTHEIEIVLGGDSEAECFIQALEFGAKILRGQYGVFCDPEKKEETIE